LLNHSGEQWTALGILASPFLRNCVNCLGVMWQCHVLSPAGKGCILLVYMWNSFCVLEPEVAKCLTLPCAAYFIPMGKRKLMAAGCRCVGVNSRHLASSGTSAWDFACSLLSLDTKVYSMHMQTKSHSSQRCQFHLVQATVGINNPQVPKTDTRDKTSWQSNFLLIKRVQACAHSH
jgi:hypothetical protein